VTTTAARSKRRYDNTLRRERANETRDRIIAAAAELTRRSLRDWRGLTVAAVAERAGVTTRTVYRHFANERALRDAVMEHLQAQAGVDLAQIEFDDIAAAVGRTFAFLSSYPLGSRPPLDPTLEATSRRRRDALLAAIADATPGWTATDRTAVAAMFDVLWSVAAYERLVGDWELAPDDAAQTLTWAARVVEDAVRDGRRPSRSKAS
jgi:AcrR family transcriptional regulator